MQLLCSLVLNEPQS